MIPGRNGEQTDRANNTAVAQLWLGRDDGIRDIMIDCLLISSHQHVLLQSPSGTLGTYGMRFQLDLQFCSILERPLHDLGVCGSTVNGLALGQCGPEGREV
jgi:hypothetical protein